MTIQSVDRFNRRVDALYRALYLHDTLTAIASSLKVSRQTVRVILSAAEKDERVVRSVVERAREEMRKADREYERIYQCRT